MTFEITTIAANETCTVALRDANDNSLFDADGNPLSVTIYGPGSKIYAQAKVKRDRRVVEYVRQGRSNLSADEERREKAIDLANCTLSFNGWTYKGKADREAMEAAYSDPSIGFITEQIDRAMGSWANFTKSA